MNRFLTVRECSSYWLMLVMSLVLSGCMDIEQIAEGGISGTGGTILKGVIIQGTVTPPNEYQLSDMQFVTVTLVEQSEEDCEGGNTVLMNEDGSFTFNDIKKGLYYICIKGSLAGDGAVGRIVRSIAIDPDDYDDDQPIINLGIFQAVKPTGVLAIDLLITDEQSNPVLNPLPFMFTRITSASQNLLAFSGSGYRDESGVLKMTYFYFETINYETGEISSDTGAKNITFFIGKLGFRSTIETVSVGGGAYQELAINITLEKASPSMLGQDNDWLAVKSGSFHSLGLKADGSLYVWGSDGSFMAGSSANMLSIMPARINSDTDWATIVGAGGLQNNYALKNDGSLWKFFDEEGDVVQVGTELWRDVDSTSTKTVGIRTDGTLWQWGGVLFAFAIGDLTNFDFDAAEANRDIQKQVGSDNDWQSLAIGSSHTVLLKHDRTLWTMGSNYCGQLGRETADNFTTQPPEQIDTNNTWAAIAAVGQMSLALKADGTLWAWGCTDATNARATPTQVGVDTDWQFISSDNSQTHSIMLIKQDHSLWSWAGWGLQPASEEYGSEWLTVDAGLFHAAAIKTDGTLWTWGDEIWNQ